MIKTALIVAGGRGLRLMPLTQNYPKPLSIFNRKPFIEYIIDNLVKNKFKKIIILTGYKNEQFKYLKKKYIKKIKIIFSNSALNHDTGKRVINVFNQLPNEFLFLYSDNFYRLNFRKIYERWIISKKNFDAILTIYNNSDNFSKSNIKISDKRIIKYDKSRRFTKNTHVDIGFAIIKKKILFNLRKFVNPNFEKVIYNYLIKKKRLTYYETFERYFSLTSPSKMPMFRDYLNNKTIFFDRDGVINECPPPRKYIKKTSEIVYERKIIPVFRFLSNKNVNIIVISNQAGIERKILSHKNVIEINDGIFNFIKNKTNCTISAFYYCPHHWNTNCECRKPKIKNFIKAHKDFKVNFENSIFIGDRKTDENCAKNLDLKYVDYKKIKSSSQLIKIIKSKLKI